MIRTQNRQMRITGRVKDQAACVEAAATVPSPLESRGEHGLGDSDLRTIAASPRLREVEEDGVTVT